MVYRSSSGTDCHMIALHYRLSLNFNKNFKRSKKNLNVQRKSKCKWLILIQGTSETDDAIFVKDFDMNSLQNVFSACVDKVQITKNRPDQTRPALKSVTTPYEIATYLYDPYTKLNH